MKLKEKAQDVAKIIGAFLSIALMVYEGSYAAPTQEKKNYSTAIMVTQALMIILLFTGQFMSQYVKAILWGLLIVTSLILLILRYKGDDFERAIPFLCVNIGLGLLSVFGLQDKSDGKDVQDANVEKAKPVTEEDRKAAELRVDGAIRENIVNSRKQLLADARGVIKGSAEYHEIIDQLAQLDRLSPSSSFTSRTSPDSSGSGGWGAVSPSP
jgi:hypothetical protein